MEDVITLSPDKYTSDNNDDDLPRVFLGTNPKGLRKKHTTLTKRAAKKKGVNNLRVDFKYLPEINLVNQEEDEVLLDLTQEDDDDAVQEPQLPAPCITDEPKNKKKKKTALEREALKQKLAEEKLAKKTAKEMNKVYKPGECMKYMHIVMHPTLSGAWYTADVPREAAAAGAHIKTEPSVCDPCALLWERVIPRTLTATDGLVSLSKSRERATSALYIMTAEQAARLVAERSLAQTLARRKQRVGCDMTLLVFGVKEYLKPSNRKTCKTSKSKKLMTEVDLEMATVDLLVETGCDTLLVDTPNELALIIMQFTKAIAEAPYKKEKYALDDQAGHYMRGDKKKCVTVDKDGNGVASLWQQMIAVLPKSSLEISRAVCAKYNSPYALYTALQEPNGIKDLANLGVDRAGVPGSKPRRLGPEFARKLHTLFTADGHVLIE